MIEVIQTIAIAALPVIFAITLHEAAHGYAARYFGDPTAWNAGRISLNPMRHIDPVGTLLVPGVILLTSSLMAGSALLFGWAKPVPVNFGRLRQPKRDMLWVAAAGPLMNLLMAFTWAVLFKLAIVLPHHLYTVPLAEMSRIGINVNIVCPLAWTAQLENFQKAYPEAFKANVKMPPAGHYGDVEKEIGRACVQLASPDFKYMNGETITLEGGMGQRP